MLESFTNGNVEKTRFFKKRSIIESRISELFEVLDPVAKNYVPCRPTLSGKF